MSFRMVQITFWQGGRKFNFLEQLFTIDDKEFLFTMDDKEF